MRLLSIFGSTGSIGKNTLEVARHLREEIQVVALAARSNVQLLKAQIEEFRPQLVVVGAPAAAKEIRAYFPTLRVLCGEEGLLEMASDSGSDTVVMAIGGMVALGPSLAALEAGKRLCLANKETLVGAGELILEALRKGKGELLPIDSEHSALFQCLEGKSLQEVRRLILTASGGPFRLFSSQQLAQVTVAEALAHPTWKMGPKVTIDSSTLVNKALEVIEAHYFFGLPPERIEVVIHPQSVVHGIVEMMDGSSFAEMSPPHMIYPIQYALTYPERRGSLLPGWDLTRMAPLEFYAPDMQRFPALGLAYDALRTKGSLPCFFNAANEVLVDRFLGGEIPWLAILDRLKRLMERHSPFTCNSIEAVLAVDREARELAKVE